MKMFFIKFMSTFIYEFCEKDQKNIVPLQWLLSENADPDTWQENADPHTWQDCAFAWFRKMFLRVHMYFWTRMLWKCRYIHQAKKKGFSPVYPHDFLNEKFVKMIHTLDKKMGSLIF